MVKSKLAQLGIAALGLAAGISLMVSSNEAHAAGCNGVVSPLEWGCAAWDNNNGPQYPHYKKPAKAQGGAKLVAPARGTAPQQPNVQQNRGSGIVSRDGAGLIGPDGASMRR